MTYYYSLKSLSLILSCFCYSEGSYSAGIDHIMVRNSWKIWTSRARLFNTEPLMSDHIGVATTVRKLWFSKSNKGTKLEEELGAKMAH